jgi:hypothetical protein
MQNQHTAAESSTAPTPASAIDFDSYLSACDPEFTALEALMAETPTIIASRLKPRHYSRPHTFLTVAARASAASGRTALAHRLRALSASDSMSPGIPQNRVEEIVQSK